MRETLRAAVALGVASGCLEVGLRAEPRLGLSEVELLTWLALGVVMGLAVALPAGLVAGLIGRRSVGLTASALIALHAALWYRFEVVLNLFVRDPRVWGGLLGIAVGSLVIGLLLDKPLRRGVKALGALALVGAAMALVRGQAPGAVPGDGPNVLLVTLDTTRPDRLGPYGGPAATPTLDRLAREGTIFTQAIAPAPLTEPSHLALFTGKPVYATGVVSNGTEFGDRPNMIQRRMQSEGMRTGGFVSGFPLHGKWGWLQGYDVYDDDFGDVPGLHRLSLVRLWEQLFLPGNTLRERYGELTAARTLSFLNRNRGGRWFVWMHLFDPHAPYEVPQDELDAAPRDGAPLEMPEYLPPPYRTITDVDWIIRTYDREIEKADGLVGEVIARLEADGVLDNTIVVVTADHGESLTEHDYLFDHGDYLYDASLRIPLIVRYPPAVEAGEVVDCQVSTTDVLPTLLNLLGMEPMDELGRSLADALGGGRCTSAAVVSSTVAGRFVEVPPVDHSIRSTSSKYIAHEDRETFPKDEFFDLEADVGETENLIEARAEDAAAARDLLGRLLEGGQVEVEALGGSESDLETLRALGYIE